MCCWKQCSDLNHVRRAIANEVGSRTMLSHVHTDIHPLSASLGKPYKSRPSPQSTSRSRSGACGRVPRSLVSRREISCTVPQICGGDNRSAERSSARCVTNAASGHPGGRRPMNLLESCSASTTPAAPDACEGLLYPIDNRIRSPAGTLPTTSRAPLFSAVILSFSRSADRPCFLLVLVSLRPHIIASVLS